LKASGCQLLPLLLASGVKIVIDHLGRLKAEECPDGAAFRAIVDAAAKGRTWVKASGPHRVRHATEVLRRLAGEISIDRLVWASDCPFVGEEALISYQGTLDWLRQALPDPSVQRKVMSENAIALYGFDNAA